MAELGFFRQAAADPDRVALVAPDGTEVTAGQLGGTCQPDLATACGRSASSGATRVAVVVPNGVEMMELVLGAQQIGLYMTPINHHLVGPEIAYIVQRQRREGARRSRALRRRADGRRGRGELPRGPALRHRLDSRVGVRTASSPTASPTPVRRTAPPGAPMHYTSGTTGQPKGVKRALADIDPDEMGALYSMFLMMFGVQPEDGNVHITGSPLYHTAVLLWTTNSLHLGHKVVLMDKWSPEEMLRLIDKHRVTTSHMVPTQFHRLLALPEDVRAKYDVSSLRCMVHAAAPCPIEIKRRMIDWWGDSIMEYYAATEGGGTIVTAKEWLERPGTVGKAWTGSEIRILDDDGNQLPPAQIGTVYMALAQATFEYKGDPEKTQRQPARRVLHRRRRRRARRRRLPVPPRPQDRHDHQRRRQHLPRRDRRHVPHLPARRRRRHLRHPQRGLGRGDQGRRSSPPRARRPGPRSRPSCASSPRPTSRRTSARSPTTSPPRCPATRAASSTSASSATPTGKASSERSDRSAPRIVRSESSWRHSGPNCTNIRRGSVVLVEEEVGGDLELVADVVDAVPAVDPADQRREPDVAEDADDVVAGVRRRTRAGTRRR